MLTLPPSVRIYICTQPTDLRRGFDGLAAATREVIRQDPESGHLFAFLNRRKNRVKILFWDRTGYALFYKRLCRGTFRIPTKPKTPFDTAVQVESAQLMLMLEGLDLRGAHQQTRWRRPNPSISVATKSPV